MDLFLTKEGNRHQVFIDAAVVVTSKNNTALPLIECLQTRLITGLDLYLHEDEVYTSGFSLFIWTNLVPNDKDTQ